MENISKGFPYINVAIKWNEQGICLNIVGSGRQLTKLKTNKQTKKTICYKMYI